MSQDTRNFYDKLLEHKVILYGLILEKLGNDTIDETEFDLMYALSKDYQIQARLEQARKQQNSK